MKYRITGTQESLLVDEDHGQPITGIVHREEKEAIEEALNFLQERADTQVKIKSTKIITIERSYP